MKVREFSDMEIFQHSGKGIPHFMTGHKNCVQGDYNMGGVSSALKIERNKICVANVSDQSARKYEENLTPPTGWVTN